MATRQHLRIVIIGGGSAGISVAARLRRAGERDIGVLDPSERHYYQPLWTLVGGGRAPLKESVRPQRSVMPKGVRWIRRAAVAVDPEAQEVTLDDGGVVSYDHLVVCPGIQLDWDRVPGLEDGLGKDGLSSNYLPHTAPETWRFIRRTRSGSAVFSAPAGAIKCGGAPQKIAYLAADYWREQASSAGSTSTSSSPRPASSPSRSSHGCWRTWSAGTASTSTTAARSPRCGPRPAR